MIEIIQKDKCTGCGACLNACPKQAITMQFDEEGFEYPLIHQELCIDCGICQKKCPSLHYDETFKDKQETNTIQKGFAARNKDYKERIISSSGSIFAVIAHYVLEKGGIVVGVAYDQNFNAVYKIIENIDDLPKIQGSKYLQCKADVLTFKRIKDELKKGRKVLFTGLACQVEGLQSFLGREYDCLFCLDLICMGIPSPMVWQMYLQTYFKGEKIKEINFKEKSEGWNHFNILIRTNKQNFKQYGMINPYFKSMFNTYNMRKSCFVCPYKKIERLADITLGDCWGANALVPEIDDNKGLSSVIIHTEKGKKIWDSISLKIDKVELPIEEIIKGNLNMIENRNCDETKRKNFYELLNNGQSEKAFHFAEIDGVYPPSMIQRAYNKIKKYIGLYEHKSVFQTWTMADK